ncbi:outer membrane protein assembly factor BamB family protein, partial [Micromonospora sp. NPDC004336]
GPTPTLVAGPEGVTPALPTPLAPTLVAGAAATPTAVPHGSPHGPQAQPGAVAPASPAPHGPQAQPGAVAPASPMPHGASAAAFAPAGSPVPYGSPGHAPDGHGGPPPGVPAPPRQGGWAPPPAWPGVPVSGAPVSPPPGSGRTAPASPRRRALWITVGAVVALAGVVTATVLYLTRDRYPALEFRTSVEVVGRVAAGADRPTAMFTAVLGDRAYLAHPLDDGRLEVTAVDAGTGAEQWRKRTGTSAERWDRIVALPGAVAVFADAVGDDTPRDLVLLDGASGEQRWRRPVRGDDDVLFGEGVAVLVDRAGKRLVGLRLGDGGEVWARDSPRDEYGGARTSVHPVTTEEALGGPAFVDGSPRDPWRG